MTVLAVLIQIPLSARDSLDYTIQLDALCSVVLCGAKVYVLNVKIST